MRYQRFEPGRLGGELLAQLAEVHGFGEPVADLTYGKGALWTHWRPDDLDRFDLTPRNNDVTAFDWRTEHLSRKYATVIIDPPYKLSGTPTAGFDGVDGRFGVDRQRPPREVLGLYASAIATAAEALLADGYIVVKAQDQVNGGKVRSQLLSVLSIGEEHGLRLVDYGTCGPAKARDQSHRGRQRHLAANGSWLIVLG